MARVVGSAYACVKSFILSFIHSFPRPGAPPVRCDWQDGRWKNNGVDYRCLDNRALIEFSCKPKATTPKASPGTFGYAKDSAQYTKCGLIVQGNGFVTYKNPRVTWGKHTGYPHKHSNNNFNNYCKSLGYTAGSYGSAKYGTVKCSKGALFWCKGYDNPKAYHWCVSACVSE